MQLNLKRKIEIQSLGDDGFHIFCKVTLNGLRCRALIDTGASKSVLNFSTYKALGLKEFLPADDNQMLGIVPGITDFTFVTLDRVSLGKFEVRNMIVGVVDLEHVMIQYSKLSIKPFDFIIGGDILTKGKAVINYKEEWLTLS